MSETILSEAENLIYGERAKAYGEARPAFEQYARMWSVVLKSEITAEQVALCMACLKICRESFMSKRDNIVDACGYLALIEKMSNEKNI